MSREIKFRAWNSNVPPGMMYSPEQVERWGLRILKSEHCALMQYTGIKDKNGKEIYEGDLVEHRNGINMLLGGPYEVRWGQFGFTLHTEGGPESHYITPTQLVVVGNRYESLPEDKK